LRRIVRLVPNLRIEPAHHAATAAAAGPENVAAILGEEQVVRPEAGVDHVDLFGRRVIHF
jgi:hypothetical protein